jgi:hypothetical protein
MDSWAQVMALCGREQKAPVGQLVHLAKEAVIDAG